MDHITALFHHRGHSYKGRYMSKLSNILFEIDKDHFSLTGLKSNPKDIEYDKVEAFYVEDPVIYRFVKFKSEYQLYNCVKELRCGSNF